MSTWFTQCLNSLSAEVKSMCVMLSCLFSRYMDGVMRGVEKALEQGVDIKIGDEK